MYVISVPLVGTIAVLIYGALTYGAQILAQSLEGSAFIGVFAAAFIGGWIIQFVGHGFEGRRPALFDNLLQIFMAPAFLIAEMVFAPGLEQRLKAEIENRMPRYLPDTAGSELETADAPS